MEYDFNQKELEESQEEQVSILYQDFTLPPQIKKENSLFVKRKPRTQKQNNNKALGRPYSAQPIKQNVISASKHFDIQAETQIISKLKKELNEAKQEVLITKSQLQAMKSQFSKQEKIIKTLVKNVNSKSKQPQHQSNHLSRNLYLHAMDIQQRMQNATAQVEKLKRNVQNTKIAEIDKEVQTYKNEISRLQTFIKATADEEKKRKQLIEKQRKEEELQIINEKMEKLEEELSQLQQENLILQQNSQNSVEQLEQLNKKMRDLERANKNAQHI